MASAIDTGIIRAQGTEAARATADALEVLYKLVRGAIDTEGTIDTRSVQVGLLTVSGAATIDDTLTVGGAASTGGDLTVTGSVIADQGAEDDAIYSGASSDVAHGMTTLAATDIYVQVVKGSATLGGVSLIGYSERTDGVGAQVIGRSADGNTTTSTAGRGYVEVQGQKKSGTSAGAVDAGENVFGVRNNTTAEMLVQAGTRTWFNGYIGIKDGVSEPGTLSGTAWIYVDTSDGDLKVKFGDGTVATIVIDT